MNVKNFDHAKIILDHIKLSLKFEFSSPVRVKEVKSRNTTRGVVINFNFGEDEEESKKLKLPKVKNTPALETSNKSKRESKNTARRRRSFDSQV